MKRLISWLLALTLIFGLVPMSAMAATDVEIGGDDADVEVDFGELVGPTYIDLDTVVTQGPGSTFEVTVPAGESVYYKGSARYAGLVATIDGETEIPLTRADDGFVYLTITNETAEAKTYTVVVNYPLGSDMNPVVIEDMNWYYGEVSQAAGDFDGYYYTYTATETGVVTLYFNAVYDDNGDLVENVGVRDIMVTNMNTYAQYTLQQDGVDNFGLELIVPVEAGQQLMIITSWVKDAAGNYYPAAEYSWTGNFAYPEGSEQNPITIEWNWDDEYANATASVEVTANGTYFNGYEGMILTANGTEIAQENGVFVLNAGTYELALATPVGAYNNPEVIENIDGYTDSNSLAEGGSYSYIWTATEAGTVTLDVTAGANIVVDQITGISEDGWPISVQHELATVEYDESWNASWVVAENLTIEVEAGQQLKIQVQGLTDWSTWTTPAIDYTLTGEFESAAVPAPEYNVVTSGYNVDMASELLASCKFLIPTELKTDPNAIIRLEFVGKTTEYNIAQYISENGVDSKGRIQVKQPINSGFMNQNVTVTILDGNGNAANFTDAYGDTFTGSYEFGVENYVKSLALYGASDSMIAAVEALLTYGSYAQVYFKSKGVAGISDEPAYNILTKYGFEPVDISAFSTDLLNQTMTSSGASFGGISVRGGTPYLEAAIYMDIQFNATTFVDESYIDNYTYELTYTVGTQTVTQEIYPSKYDARNPAKNDYRIVFTVENIAAALFDCMYSITVTDKATGEQYTGSYSMICYFDACFKSYASNPAQADFLNMLKAMYYYNQAANVHFGK